MNQGLTTIPPDLADLLDLHKGDVFAQLRVALPGQIVTFDAAKRTAVVQPSFNRTYNDGTEKPMPLLVDVPVLTLQGGGIHVGLPITPGDECLVVFADSSIDAWFSYGGQQTPLDARKHDLSDGFALVGLNSQAKPLVTPLLALEGGIAGTLAKVAVNKATQMITVANGPLPANSLGGILQTLLAAMVADPGLSAPTKAAAGAAATALATLLY